LDIVFENLDGQRGRTVLDECIGNLFQQSQVGTFLIDLIEAEKRAAEIEVTRSV
jgi:hypothetical protein